jgi:hypothetical protein
MLPPRYRNDQASPAREEVIDKRISPPSKDV